jgi:hypothetical protein
VNILGSMSDSVVQRLQSMNEDAMAKSLVAANAYIKESASWNIFIEAFLLGTEYTYMFGLIACPDDSVINITHFDKKRLMHIAEQEPLENLPKLLEEPNGVGVFARIRLARGV